MFVNLILCVWAYFLNTQWKRLFDYEVWNLDNISHTGKLTLEQIEEARGFLNWCNIGTMSTFTICVCQGVTFIIKAFILFKDLLSYLFSLAF